MKTAVITTDELEFKRFVKSRPEERKKDFAQIKVLSDIKENQYGRAILLIGSKNVTDLVIMKTLNASLTKTDYSSNLINYNI
jgi:hypothetical protein